MTKKKLKHKKKKLKRNPIKLEELLTKIAPTIYIKEEPFILEKILGGGNIQIRNNKGLKIVKINDDYVNLFPYKKTYGFSKLNIPVYQLIDFYSISGNENQNLRTRNNTILVLDFAIYTEVNADKLPIPGIGWKYKIFLEEKTTGREIVKPVKSIVDYPEREMAFYAAKKMIEERFKVLVPRNIEPKRRNIYFPIQPIS